MRCTTLVERTAACRAGLHDIAPLRLEGRIAGLSGLVVDIDGLSGHVSVGDRLLLAARHGQEFPRKSSASATVWRRRCRSASLDGLGPGIAALFHPHPEGEPNGGTLPVSNGWLGRVLDPLGRPLDGQGPLPPGPHAPARPRRTARCDGPGAAGSAARCRRARAQLLRHLPPGAAARPVLRLRHRQVDPARHAGAPHRLRCRRARPGRRAGARGAGVPRGRSGRGRTGALRGGGRHLGFAAAAASRGGICRHDRGRAFPRPGAVGAAADGQRHPVLPGIA